jgi:plastocyanin
VAAKDDQGNVVPVGGTVNIALGPGGPAGTLGGTTEVRLSQGMASFIDLTLTGGGGKGYTLALSPGNVTSNAFNVGLLVGDTGMMFTPAAATAKVNDEVLWVWLEDGHDVVSGTPGHPDGQFCSPSDMMCSTVMTLPLGMAQSLYTHRFASAGTYPFYCSVHNETGMITVQ